MCSDASDLHHPVLLAEVIEALSIDPNGKYIDCTFGRGGHSQEILKSLGGNGRLLAIDQDITAIEYGKSKFVDDSRLILEQRNFSQIVQVAKQNKFENQVNGIFFDLGVSSPQLDNPDRGFSFMHDGPLDMRMNTTQGVSAAEWLKKVTVVELGNVLKEYGQERYSKRIANAVIERRIQQPITTTKELADLVLSVVGRSREKKHPATRTFQAVRIYINQELESLSKALDECLSLLANSGRLLVITFHSLEDQVVKKLLHKHTHSNLPRKLPVVEQHEAKLKRVCKAIKPSDGEVSANPRARSAKLHVLEWATC
ncbi:MAG: 16S rRNA (cytosine(1402)-N(4))-methyltransferase RsmH [Gammaproteobacteria bacterium]|nr:MAG: 16S rRNA (cytosine(1402)-N(4))-methyltransferase RsmH [Gammaproteobacteria bacterium]